MRTRALWKSKGFATRGARIALKLSACKLMGAPLTLGVRATNRQLKMLRQVAKGVVTQQ